jgi:ABC-type nitrate/sulfonate/bicarbonate transport system substrate-binding protein
LQRFVRAVGRGIAFTLKNPDHAFAAYVRANPKMKLDDDLNRKSFRATLPTYARTETQARDRWEMFDQWLATRKVIPSAVPVDDLYTNLAR